MKKTITLLLLLASISFANAQSSIGLHFGTGLSHALGTPEAVPMKDGLSHTMGLDFYHGFNKSLSLYTSFSLLSISEIYDLRWGSQHNGLGHYESTFWNSVQRASYFFSTELGVKYYITQNKIRLFVQPYVETAIFINNANPLLSAVDEKPEKYSMATGIGFGTEINLGRYLSLYLMPEAKLLFTDVWYTKGGKTIIPSVRLGVLYKL